MLNNIVNRILYLYSSTTIFFALNSSQRRRLTLTPVLREKKKPLLSTESLSPFPQKALQIMFFIYCRFYSNIELVKALF